jgi:RNA polymerase sigma factor (sigma-70 family)
VIEGDRGLALRQIGALFRAGTFAGMSDGQLLEHFLARHGEAGELAFAVLIERHGPMVLRVCRGALRSRVDAEDAFQATFLALVRGAGSIRNRDSLAPWLHGAALRVSACARSAQERRKTHEGRYAARRSESIREGDRDDLGAVLHEEIGRLPARYRAAVVLCDLQGLPLVDAAVQLGCPVGTIKSRVARGRERLRARLVRRGVIPAAGLGVGLVGETAAAVGPALVDATARAAIQLAAGRGTAGMLAASVEYLLRSNSRSILMRRVWTLTASLATAAVLAAGVASLAQQPGGGGGGGAAAPRQDPQMIFEAFPQKTYRVGDLLGVTVGDTNRPQGQRVDMGPVIELISTTIAPGTWDIYNNEGRLIAPNGRSYDNLGREVGPDGQPLGPGGADALPGRRPGRIIPFQPSVSLLIQHTEAVHAQVEERLAQLRRLAAAKQKNEAPGEGGMPGMGAAGAPGGMGMMRQGMGMMGGGGGGGPMPGAGSGMGASGGSGGGGGMAGMMGGGKSGGGPAKKGSPGGMPGGAPGMMPGMMGGAGMQAGSASKGSSGSSGMMPGGPGMPSGPGASGGRSGGDRRGSLRELPGSGPGASGGSSLGGPGGLPTDMPGAAAPGGEGETERPIMHYLYRVEPGAAAPGGEGETERRLRALEEKLDRVLKALDVPKAKTDFQKAGGLGS